MSIILYEKVIEKYEIMYYNYSTKLRRRKYESFNLYGTASVGSKRRRV